jgi:hypothetical protein
VFCTTPLASTSAATSADDTGKAPVTRKISWRFGRSRNRLVRFSLVLNKLGRSLLAESTTLQLQTRREVRDRQGSALSALFRTLLRRGWALASATDVATARASSGCCTALLSNRAGK